MAEIDLRFSPLLIMGSLNRMGIETLNWGKQALMVVDASMDDAASFLQEKLDERDINTIVYAREGLSDDTATLNSVLSLARGSHARMVVALGGEKVLSLGRLVAAAAPGRMSAYDMFTGTIASADEAVESLPCLELPSSGRHPLLFRNQATLTDTATRRTAVVKLPFPPTKIALIDAALPVSLSPRLSALSMATVLMAAAEAFLSPRASFLSDLQAKHAVRAAAGLLNRVNRDSLDLDYRSDEAEAAVVSALATGFTAPGPGVLLSWAVAAAADVPRAAVSALLFPWLLESPLYAGSPRIGELAALISPGSDSSAIPSETLRSVFGRLGLPGRLREIGADLSDVLDSAQTATEMLGYERTDLNQDTFRGILELAS